MPEQPKDGGYEIIRSGRPDPTDIHGAGSMLYSMLKKAARDGAKPSDSNIGSSEGRKYHLIDKFAARELRDFNSTHAICIDAKKSSSVGLGHRDLEIHETLDPLTRHSWQDTLDALAEDYWETGECFLEVVFNDSDENEAGDVKLITGLYHLESASVSVEVENDNNTNHFHYVVVGEQGTDSRVMAKWGDMGDLKARYAVGGSEGSDAKRTTLTGEIVDSEIIHIRQSTNRSPYYGYPDYMSAVPSIELVQCMTQHEFDFYFNRGVPEFLLFLLGKNIGGCWEDIKKLIQANQGLGNSHKTGAVHIAGDPQETVVQVEKLAMEDAGNSGFSEKSGTLDMRVCTAHGMPPQLANIALPGKIGAANEGPNAMLTFQMRKLGQSQKNFSRRFASTLGMDGVKFLQPTGAPKALSADKFLGKGAKPMSEDGVPQFVQPGNGFNTILDGMTLGAQNTMSEMREPLAGSGRNPDDGKLDGARDRKPGDPKATRGPGTGK